MVGFREERRGIIYSLSEMPKIMWRTLIPIIMKIPLWKKDVDSFQRRAESNGRDMFPILEEFIIMERQQHWFLTVTERQKEGREGGKAREDEVREEDSVHFMTTQSVVGRVEIWARTQCPQRNTAGPHPHLTGIKQIPGKYVLTGFWPQTFGSPILPPP